MFVCRLKTYTGFGEGSWLVALDLTEKAPWRWEFQLGQLWDEETRSDSTYFRAAIGKKVPTESDFEFISGYILLICIIQRLAKKNESPLSRRATLTYRASLQKTSKREIYFSAEGNSRGGADILRL